MWGITSRVARENGYKGEMRFMPREEAIRIYHACYWLPIRGDDLPLPLAFQVFDGAVNSGPVQAIIWLQRALGVKDDGIFGPITLAAAQKASVLETSLLSIASRGDFQASLPTWPAFGKSWAKRNYQNLRYLTEDFSA